MHDELTLHICDKNILEFSNELKLHDTIYVLVLNNAGNLCSVFAKADNNLHNPFAKLVSVFL